MDMQKEREAFSNWFGASFTNGKIEFDADGVPIGYEKAIAWQAWKAAKASAVPDGFKVVAINYECAWCGCTELGGFSDEAMVEAAQEPGHDR